MRRKITSIVLALAIVLAMLPTYVAAADTCLKVSSDTLTTGETVTLTYTVPNAVANVASISVNVAFDKSAFEVASVTYATVTSTKPISSTAEECNASGKIAASWSNDDGAMNIAAGTALFTANLSVKDAASGDFNFTVEDISIADAAADSLNTTAGVDETAVAVKIVSLLSSLTISNLDAPVKGEPLDPEASYAAGESNGPVSVSWYEGSSASGTAVTGNAKAKQVYTAKMVIGAPTGYKFAENVTVEGYDVTRDSDTQITVTKTFSATSDKALTGIAVSTNPSKVEYTHGDALDTAGMVVTATYDDGSTDAVTDYTVSYASGKYLKKDDTTATVTYGGKTADVTGLTVAAKELTVEGLKATDREYDTTTTVALTGGKLVGVIEGETVTATMPTSGEMKTPDTGENKPVSFAPITLTGADAANYTVKQPEVTVTITGKDISEAVITLGTQAVYDGTEKDVVITSVKLEGSEFTDYDITSGGKATNVEETTLVITGKGSYSGTAEATWTLQKATPTVKDFTITAPETADYTGKPIDVAAPTTDKTGMGEVTVKYDPEGHTDAGDYTVTFDVAEGDNYKAATGFEIGKLTINKIDDPAEITKTAGVEPTKMIDLSENVSGAEGEVSYSIKGDALGCTLDEGKLTAGEEKGTVTVTVTVADSTNYIGKSADITITIADRVATPVLSEATQTFSGTLEVTISCETTGAAIYYTLDGSDPTAKSEVFTSGSAIMIDKNTTLKAIGILDGYLDSEIAEATYTKQSSGGGGGSNTPAEPTPAENDFPFTDVPENAYYRKPVEWALANGITSGTTPTTFGPFDVTTRGQMITFLWIAKGSPEPTSAELPFKDVAEGAYYYKAVLWAYENGITAGVSADEFAPDQAVTRAQAVTFLYGVAGRPAAGSEPFEDVADTDWFAAPVAWAYNNGITSGTSATMFSPDAACQRAQIITFMAQYFAE